MGNRQTLVAVHDTGGKTGSDVQVFGAVEDKVNQ